MKIGMVTACYKPVLNGVTRMVSLYKQELEKLGHQVTIFTLGDPDPAGEEAGVVRSPAIPVGSGYYFTMRYTREAQELLAEMEIIHCHHLFMSVEMAHRYGRCPIVYTNHTRYDLYTGAYVSIPQPAADAIMRQVWPEFTDLADLVITPSDSVRQIMLDFGVQRPIVVVENGVDLRPFRNPPRPFTKESLGIPAEAILLVYVGRLSSEKNLEVLLEQFAVAQELLPKLHLLLIGTGTIQDELELMAQDLGISPQVHFSGAIDFAEVPNYLAAADMFVTASQSEVHPLTVIEAMAAGLPVVASSSPGIVDTVQSMKSGLLTSQPEKGLAAAIVGLALNEALRQQMSASALEESKRFDISKTVTHTVQLYEELRKTRPDLQRENAHGKWLRNWEKFQPMLDQLAGLVRPPDTWDMMLQRILPDKEKKESGFYEQ